LCPVKAENNASSRPVKTKKHQISPRHCERSEAIHLAAGRTMDCFVASLLAMMGWTAPNGISVPDW
jgi:hypothetical protein